MPKQIPLVDKLRLYAMLMRLQELKIEREVLLRLERLKTEIAMEAFLPEPMIIKSNRELFDDRMYYNPNSYEIQPSKFIGKPRNNYKKR